MALIATISIPVYVLQCLVVLFLQQVCETPNFYIVTEDTELQVQTIAIL